MITNEDLVAKRFNNFLVLSFYGTNKHNKRTWLCKCDCGNERIVATRDLKTGHIKSCGCLKIEILKSLNTRHGQADKTSEYKSWQDMKARCINPNNKAYKYYGGKGIEVCKSWIESFDEFFKDMGIKPDSKLTLDRIDYNKNYCKENCRWASRKIQTSNTSRNRYIEYNGEVKILQDWANILGINKSTLRYHLENKSMEDVFNFYQLIK